jgi:hypothetical protein
MSNETNEKLSALFIFDVYSLLPLSRMTSVLEPDHLNNQAHGTRGDSETVQTSKHWTAVERNSVLRVVGLPCTAVPQVLSAGYRLITIVFVNYFETYFRYTLQARYDLCGHRKSPKRWAKWIIEKLFFCRLIEFQFNHVYNCNIRNKKCVSIIDSLQIFDSAIEKLKLVV